MKNEELKLSETDFAEIRRVAAEFQVEELHFRQTKKGGNYPFQHISRVTPWVFVVDWHWRRRWLRFNKEYILRLDQAGLLVDREAHRNCSISYKDFTKALQLCVSDIR